MHRIANLAQIVVWQHQASGRFHMRRKDHIWLLAANGRHHFVHRTGRPGCLMASVSASRLEHRGFGRDLPHLENLCPSVAEPPVANHHGFLAGGKLPRHGLHAKRTASGYED